VLVLLTLPVTFLSLGLFVLVINALLFWLVATLVDGFHVAGFWSAFLAAILYSVISWALSTLLLRKNGNS
jgi:putative membrane protein